ncbi:MAG: nucleotidyltransferase domain-containing protein [Clostridia bacterium]|nr:nucleotidyltransferase domain-containing protein [Clostridia bacterium]
MSLKQQRKAIGLTQEKCAEYLNIPLRSYKRYEADESKIDPIKYGYITNRLNMYGYIDEETGLLTKEQIQKICGEVFASYPVEYCYLFGSYAKNKATESSDVDLLISMPVDGLKFYELNEMLREKLKKRVDLLDAAQLNNNPALTQEILKDGIKIYG